MNLNQTARYLNVSERTLRNYIRKLETEAGTEVTIKQGRTRSVKDEYLGRLTALAAAEAETVDIQELAGDTLEAELVETADIFVENRSLTGHIVATPSITLGRLDTSVIEKATERNWNTYRNTSALLNNAVIQLAENDAEALAEQVKNIYARAFAKAKAEVAEEALGGN